MTPIHSEIMILRSLAESDLGLFAAHRKSLTGRQRAININAPIAQQLLASDLYANGEATLKCICVYGDLIFRDMRKLAKPQKNWRLGGKAIEGDKFLDIDCKDFVLIRSVANNDGSLPITISFISRASNPSAHARLVVIAQHRLKDSMACFAEAEDAFTKLAPFCPRLFWDGTSDSRYLEPSPATPIPLMPREDKTSSATQQRSLRSKLRSPHILEHMLRASSDLSAPAQFGFMDTVEQLASQLRRLLLQTGRISRIDKDHGAFWPKIAKQRVGFVDGGLANLSMFGAAPIAARVGGYAVIPGDHGSHREDFIDLKHLIDELYTSDKGGVYDGSFPDVGALRDAARISIEAAGGVQMLSNYPDLRWLLIHGALVNPVSRYTDVMRNGQVRHRFPNFSGKALADLLPAELAGSLPRDRNFISVHLRQLERLQSAETPVCGVVERESSTSSVCRAVLDSLDDHLIHDLLPVPPARWKTWFRNAVDPSGDDDFEGQRISDSLLFRCVLEPGELLFPVELDRNELRRAPKAWVDVISRYPKPRVSYLQVTEWSSPIRLEIFEKDLGSYREIAELVMHCALLLPRYAFPVGLDIVDKFARIPNWMSRPINTHTAVQALKAALDEGDASLFDSLRRILCGSGREFLTRPDIFR